LQCLKHYLDWTRIYPYNDKMMAKDKTKEAEYKAEGLRRAYIRLNKRTREWRLRGQRGGGNIRNGKKCPDCGGTMIWCCEQWSKICCHDYGTCPCS
jgi:hypothetical protein